MPQQFTESYIKTIETIKKYDKFLIISHDFPDGDCLGSQLAFFELLKLLNKKVTMFCSSELPYQYSFLPNSKLIENDFEKISKTCLNGSCVCVCLDCSDERRFSLDMGRLRQRTAMLINIDHHPGNTRFGDINITDPDKSATAEILYEFFMYGFADLINYNIALDIYTGILTDTGKFQYENTTGNVHKAVSRLLEYGIVPADIFSHIYENEPFKRFKLLEVILKRIKLDEGKRIIYSYILQRDFDALGLPFSANDGIIELLRSASGARVAALIKEVGKKNYKVSLRSTDTTYSVAELAAKFGGGGHKMAAAYSKTAPLKEVIASLLNFT
jgi:bifunctional oligoribonuclease and PAP phosphatase NrnA